MYTCSKPSAINQARRLEKLFFLFKEFFLISRRRIRESAPLIYFQKFGGDILCRIHLEQIAEQITRVAYVVIAVKEHKYSTNSCWQQQ